MQAVQDVEGCGVLVAGAGHVVDDRHNVVDCFEDIVVLRKTIFLLLAILAFALQMEFLYAIHLFQIVFIMPELMNVLRSLTLNGA